MKNITLALAIALGFCVTEAGTQASGLGSLRERRAARGQQRKMDLEQKLPDNLRDKMTPEEIQEYDLWTTWPKEVFWNSTNIVMTCEEEYKVVFYGAFNKINNIEWVRGCGRCLIERGNNSLLFRTHGDSWKKFDSDGVLLRAGAQRNFDEFIWMTNRAHFVTIENRKKWAGEHGMSYEDAVIKRKVYFDALRARKEELEAREARAAAEKTQREKERAEKRAQLLQTQEELRKAREAKKAKEEE